MKNLIKEIDGELDKELSKLISEIRYGETELGFIIKKKEKVKSFLHSSILKAVKRAFERTRIEKREEEKRGGDSELEYFTIGFNTALNLKSQKEKEVISLLEKVE